MGLEWFQTEMEWFEIGQIQYWYPQREWYQKELVQREEITMKSVLDRGRIVAF